MPLTRRLSGETDKTKLNAHLQQAHGINKRQANAAITEADGMIAGAKDCRSNHIKQLEGQTQSGSGLGQEESEATERFP